jgi:hypothetical protein
MHFYRSGYRECFAAFNTSSMPLTTYLGLEFESEIFFAQNNSLDRHITFPNASNDIVRRLKTVVTPNGGYKIIACHFKDKMEVKSHHVNAIIINGRVCHSLSEDVSQIWPTTEAQVRCDIYQLRLAATAEGFLSFFVVKVLDVQSVRIFQSYA